MIPVFTLIFFVLGLIIGSFLNVVIFRLNTERSFGGRSGCMTCQNQLSWYELIPVLSFLGLRGRCRKCRVKISWQYPLIEFITGVLFAGLFLKFQDFFFLDTMAFAFAYAFYGVSLCLLLVIAAYDFRHKIIPDALSLMLGIVAFLGLFFFNASGFYPHWPSVWEFLAGPILAAPFALFWLVSRGRWMGLGDAKLAIGLGWLLGLSRAFSGVVAGFWLGALAGLLLVIFSRKRYGLKSEMPFAPFLVAGAILALLFELHLFGI